MKRTLFLALILALGPTWASTSETASSGALLEGLTSATRVNITTSLATDPSATNAASAIGSMSSTGWYYGLGNANSTMDVYSADATAGTVSVIGRMGYSGSYLAGTQDLSSLLSSSETYVTKTLTSLTVSFDASQVTGSTKVALFSYNGSTATELSAAETVTTGTTTLTFDNNISLGSNEKLFLVLTDTSWGTSFTIGNLTASGTVTTTDTTDAHTWANGTTSWTADTVMADGETKAGDITGYLFDGCTDTISVGSVTADTLTLKNESQVTLTDGTLTAASGGLTITGSEGTSLSIGSAVAGGALTVSGAADVTLTGERSSSSNVTVESGASLTVTDGGKLFNNNSWNEGVLTVRGHLTVDSIAYGADLGKQRHNANSLYLCAGGTLTIDGSGSGTRGMTLFNDWRDWGGTRTIELTEGNTYSWNKADNANIVEGKDGTGANMTFLIQDDAKLTFAPELLSSIGLTKTGAGELEVAGSASSARILNAAEGTVTVSGTLTVANETTIAEGAAVNVSGTLNGGAVSLNGTLTVADGTLSVSTIAIGDAGVLDLGGADSAVDVTLADISRLSEAVVNAGTLSGSLTLTEDAETTDSELGTQFTKGIGSEGTMSVTLESDLSDARALFGNSGLSIAGTEGSESMELSGVTGLQSAALYSSDGDVTLSNLADVSLLKNTSSTEVGEDFFRAGAVAASGSVTIEASGNVTLSENSVDGNPDSAGGIYGGSGISITADGELVLQANTAGPTDGSEAESTFHGGALNGNMGDIALSAAIITIADNQSAGEGGALYASGDITMEAENITVSGNKALTADGGAIVSEGSLTITAGAEGVSFTDNSAEKGYGGAIAMNAGATLNLVATDGSVTFLGNTDQDGANDIAFTSGGTAQFTVGAEQVISIGSGLSVGEGESLALNINTDEEGNPTTDSGTVELSGDLRGTTVNLGCGTLSVGGDTYLSENESITIAAEGATFTTASGEGTLTVTGKGTEAVSITTTAEEATALSLTDSSFTFSAAAITVSTEGTIEVSADLAGSSLTLEGGGTISDATSNTELDAVAIAADTTATMLNKGTDGVTANSLTLSDGAVLSVYQGTEATEDDVATLTIADGGELTLSGQSTMNADLVMLGGTIRVEAGASVTMGCSVELSGDIRIVMTEEDIASTLGDHVNLFTSVESADLGASDIWVYSDGGTQTSYKLAYDGTNIYITPEPATATLSMLALAGFCARRRRK